MNSNRTDKSDWITLISSFHYYTIWTARCAALQHSTHFHVIGLFFIITFSAEFKYREQWGATLWQVKECDTGCPSAPCPWYQIFFYHELMKISSSEYSAGTDSFLFHYVSIPEKKWNIYRRVQSEMNYWYSSNHLLLQFSDEIFQLTR